MHLTGFAFCVNPPVPNWYKWIIIIIITTLKVVASYTTSLPQKFLTSSHAPKDMILKRYTTVEGACFSLAALENDNS